MPKVLQQKDVIQLLDASNLPGSTKSQKLAIAPKNFRMSMIRNNNKKSEEARTSAAIEIQRRVRGYRVRCNVYQSLEPKISTTAVYSDSKCNASRLLDVVNPVQNIIIDADMLEGEDPPSEEKMLIFYEEYIRRLKEEGVDISDAPSFEDFRNAFLKAWESKKTREAQRLQQIHSQHQQQQQNQCGDISPISPTPTTTPKASMMVIKKKREGPLTEADAAVCIQRAWRKHIDIQVYRYYRDLINFKTRGDPSLMLRCINPNEAKMLDPASGIHVRFRLAGERFPPNIYYKIFTHRPIVDMCANSPKDYTRPDAKKNKAKDTHNRTGAVLEPSPSKDGWYQRVENNGWRLVSDRLIHHIMSDPVTWQTSKKKYEFHHDKLVRKQDVEKRRKQKKIDWMKKMYHDGMLKAKADDYETVKLIEGAAAGMVATVEAAGPEALEEWEVDELLDWTTSLNFDDYWTTWKDIATSSHSEKKIVDKMRIMTNNMDPYEFTLSTAPSRFESTRQSHNTPVSSSSGTKIHVHVNS